MNNGVRRRIQKTGSNSKGHVRLDSRPTAGWKKRQWSTPIACCVCRRQGITEGVTHHRDVGDPPVRAMCGECYSLLMDDDGGKAFAEKYPEA